MSGGTASSAEDETLCAYPPCDSEADFWVYTPVDTDWRPLCTRHTVELHPSLELHAWLESGYARPSERERPTGPPSEPSTGRMTAFRDLITEAMGWD